MLTIEQIETFEKHFKVDLVSSPQTYKDAYSIRYRAYVEEFKFEDIKKFSQPFEKDEYDDSSFGVIIYHKQTKTPAACIRIIPADAFDELPIEKEYIPRIDNRFVSCEISRLVVDRNFRRRESEKEFMSGNYNPDDIRIFPVLSIACFISAIVVVDILSFNTCYAVMEPVLPRLLKRYGIKCNQIGELKEYHGLRAPYQLNYKSIEKNLSMEMKEFVSRIYDDFAARIFNIF